MTAEGGVLDRAFLGLLGREGDPEALDAGTLANMVAGHHSVIETLDEAQRERLAGITGSLVIRLQLAALPVAQARRLVVERRPSFGPVLNTPEGLAWLTHELGLLRKIAAGQMTAGNAGA